MDYDAYVPTNWCSVITQLSWSIIKHCLELVLSSLRSKELRKYLPDITGILGVAVGKSTDVLIDHLSTMSVCMAQ